jgi:hypothetical protein
LEESHKSGGRPAPPDGSAEYDFRFRAEEKLAVYLAAVARLVQGGGDTGAAEHFCYLE